MDNLTVEEKLARLEQKIDALLGEENSQKSVVDKKTMDTTGRITIPKTFRKILGIENSTADFLIMLKGKDIILRLKDWTCRWVNTLLNESVEQKSVEDKKTMDAMGRITIPKTFRKILGIENSTADFLIMLKGKDIILRLKDWICRWVNTLLC